MSHSKPVLVRDDGAIRVVTINRPKARNAVNRACADALADAFADFETDAGAKVAVLCGAQGHFCAGADLKAVASGPANRMQSPTSRPLDTSAPMGPGRMALSKPVIAAIAGHAVAGGLELALWCDLRIVEEDAVLGVFCRRFGVPLIDGGTVRLPRIIGLGRALDLVLTGRAVQAGEALAMGLATRVVPHGAAVAEALALAKQIAAFDQECLRADRASLYRQGDLSLAEALGFEFEQGREIVSRGIAAKGASRFVAGQGRGGRFDD